MSDCCVRSGQNKIRSRFTNLLFSSLNSTSIMRALIYLMCMMALNFLLMKRPTPCALLFFSTALKTVFSGFEGTFSFYFVLLRPHISILYSYFMFVLLVSAMECSNFRFAKFVIIISV